MHRAPIVIVVAAALVLGGVLDRMQTPAGPTAAPVVQPVPVAAPASALSSSWFCGGATDGGSDGAPGIVVIANSGSSPVTGVVTLVPSQGPNRVVPIQVGPLSVDSVAETVPHGSPWVGAIVDVDAGAVAVDQLIVSPLGRSATPCATSGSSHWYFATGMTLINAGTEISLLNPYPTDSIVDLSFSTTQGIEAPEDFQGLDVPADGMLNVDLGSHLRRRQAIATTVVARTGSVVAWETEWATPPQAGSALVGTAAAANPLADPAWPDPGVAVTLGSPSTGTSWTWPDGMSGNGVNESYLIYNPGPTTAEVRLSLDLQQGAAEPFELSVGAYQVLPVISAQQARIPAGVAHSAVLQSVNGVPVVAQRLLVATGAENGIGDLPGGRLAADQWLVPLAFSAKSETGSLVLYNPGSTAVHASVSLLTGGNMAALSAAAQVVEPGQRAVISLAGHQPIDGPLVVDSSGPVYVESDFYGVGSTTGVSLSLGVPLTP